MLYYKNRKIYASETEDHPHCTGTAERKGVIMSEKYFDYLGMLRLNDNRLSIQRLISCVNGSRLTQEENQAAIDSLETLEAVGLVVISCREDEKMYTVTLTAVGIAIADFIAHIRSSVMIKGYSATAQAVFAEREGRFKLIY